MSTLENVLILQDTLNFFEGNGNNSEEYESYMSKIKECIVFFPEDIKKIKNSQKYQGYEQDEMCIISCVDNDTFSEAKGLVVRTSLYEDDGSVIRTLCCDDVLVLNFANPYYPGGGVRRGANAQEEDLCRNSSRLFSLESEEAKKYYRYNCEHKNQDLYGNDYGNNAMILSPSVKIIGGKQGRFAPGMYIDVGVLTVAAPSIRDNVHISDEYLDLLYERINSMLFCAAHYGYKNLILGAWGCGAFGNNPEVVAKLFRDAIDTFSFDGKDIHTLFERIIFAVPYNEKRPANYMAFKEQFGN